MCEKRKSSCRSPTHIVLCSPQGPSRGDRALALALACVCVCVTVFAYCVVEAGKEKKKKPISAHFAIEYGCKKKNSSKMSAQKARGGKREGRGMCARCSPLTADVQIKLKMRGKKKKNNKKRPAIGANARRCNSAGLKPNEAGG